MRNVFRLLFIGALLFALSGTVSAAEDVTGFKGFAWGTNFEVVNQAKDLKWFRKTGRNEELAEYVGLKDTERDQKGEPIGGAFYRFYNNRLVGGEVTFFDRSLYLEAVGALEGKMGKAPYRRGTESSYVLESTIIMYSSQHMRIQFMSKQYVSESEKRDDEAKKMLDNSRFYN